MKMLDCNRFHLCGIFPIVMAGIMVGGMILFAVCEWKARKEKRR